MDPKVETRIESYLANLRRYLRELPPEEINDILVEIRSHIIDRAESAGDLTDDKIVAILTALGRPEEIGPMYESQAMISRARASFSPTLILRTTMRWAMRSVAGFSVFLAGLTGYSMSLGFMMSALLKPVFPDRVGMWQHQGGGVTIGIVSDMPAARELLGWWIIPIGIIASAVLLVATTRFLRIMLRYARGTPPLPSAA